MRYRYWLTLRPAMPGTVPTKNLECIENFDSGAYSEEAGERFGDMLSIQSRSQTSR